MTTISQIKFYTRTDLIAFYSIVQSGSTFQEALEKINAVNPDDIEKNRILSKVIYKEVLKYYEFSDDEIKSKNRRSDLVKARAFFCLFAHELTPLSYKQIAKIVNRTHPTVMHLIGKIKSDICLGYPDILNDYDNLKEILKNVNIATDGI